MNVLIKADRVIVVKNIFIGPGFSNGASLGGNERKKNPPGKPEGHLYGWVSKYREIYFPVQYYK